MAGEASPVLGVFEDVEEVALRHPGADFLLEFRDPFGPIGRRQLLQVRRPVRIDAQLRVGFKAGVDSAAAALSSRFSAAAKSSPLSGMPSAVQ